MSFRSLVTSIYNTYTSILTYPVHKIVEYSKPLTAKAATLTGVSLIGAVTIHSANTKATDAHPPTCTCAEHTPAHINELVYADTQFNSNVISQCPSMKQFCPPKYLSNGHAQTILASLYRLSPSNEQPSFNLLESLTKHIPFVPQLQHYVTGKSSDNGADAVQQHPDVAHKAEDPNINTSTTESLDTHRINYTRQHVKLRDGGLVTLDWHTPVNGAAIKQRNKPVFLALHGLTGGSMEAYMQWLVHCVSRNTDCQVVVMNARGCANTELTTPFPFNAANTEDLRQVIQLIRSDVIDDTTAMYGLGVSLGSGILLKYVREESIKYNNAPHNTPVASGLKQVGGLNGSMHVCTSFDHLHNTQSMEDNYINFYLYNKTLGANLVNYLKQHESVFDNMKAMVPKQFSMAAAYASTYIGEFDRNVIVPLFGYNDVQHYYRTASTHDALRDVAIPCFVLSAKDDPICSVHCVDTDAPKYNDNVIMCLTTHGGHVGFIEQSQSDKTKRNAVESHGYHSMPFNGESYTEKIVVEYLNALNKQRKVQQM